MHYYKRNIGDYHKKAGRLTMLQHGAYTLLIDSCYDREIFPTFENAIDWTWASTDEEIAAVKFVLSKFFVLKDGFYYQNHIQEDLAKYHENSKTNKRIAIERERKKKERDNKGTKRAQIVNDTPENKDESAPNQEPLTTNQEPLTTNQNNLKDKPSKLNDSINEIFDYWKVVMNTPKSKLTSARITKIKARLNDGYTTQQIKEAIHGCSKSEFHMGQNNNRKKYNDIELICRDGKNIEQFSEPLVEQDNQKMQTNMEIYLKEQEEKQNSEFLPYSGEDHE